MKTKALLLIIVNISITLNLSFAKNKENKEELYFGTNYIVNFSGPYQDCIDKGYDIEKVIDQDIYNISRMGLNAFRIHIWDSQISDSRGNLKENEHLRLLDYLIFKLQEKGINIMLTPIYYGSTAGKKDDPNKGFSVYYSRKEAHSNPKSIAAHLNYYKQFINHINPYTKKAYKDDPMIVGFELCNEPWEASSKDVTEFITSAIAEIRKAKCKKNIYYNCTTTHAYATDILKTGIDGATYQWYPTELKTSRELKGNFLPHIDKYTIPYSNEKFFKNKEKAIYEFGPSNIMEPYMYPAMAISFKEAGFTWATAFSYDPHPLAESNTSYYPQYLNLAYTPQKAVSLIIAKELFLNPKYKRDRINEKYPFEIEGLNLSYKNKLSEILDKDKFYYSSNTNTSPDIEGIKHIIGCGSSPIIKYSGLGVYFLDRISEKVWRLELMPDAIPIKDAMSNSLIDDTKTLIRWNKQQMKINIPELGNSFNITAVNDGNNYKAKANNGEFTISPGTYILALDEIAPSIKEEKFGNFIVKDFFAPEENGDKNKTYLLHSPTQISLANKKLLINAKIISNEEIESVKIVNSTKFTKEGNLRKSLNIKMTKDGVYDYSATIPENILKSGYFKYTFAIKFKNGRTLMKPGNENYSNLDYFKLQAYTTNIIKEKEPIQLFYAGALDNITLFNQSRDYGFTLENTGIIGKSALVFGTKKWNEVRTNPKGSTIKFAIQEFIGNKIKGINEQINEYTNIELIANALTSTPTTVKIVLINKKGEAFTGKIQINNKKNKYLLSLEDFKIEPLFLLPRPYPNALLPFWYTYKGEQSQLKLSKIEKIQLIIPDSQNPQYPELEINSITLR